MNDEEALATQEIQPDCACAETSDPLPASVSHDGDREPDLDRGEPHGTDVCESDGTVSDPCLPNPDPSAPSPASPSDPSDTGEQLEQLRGEIEALRTALSERDARISRLGEEYAEFAILYPGVSLSSLDEAVLEDVKRGIPIAAAYALAEKRRTHAAEAAAKSNAENRQRPAGTVKPTAGEYFTPDEVRRMTREEVRTHYPKIVASMQKWR